MKNDPTRFVSNCQKRKCHKSSREGSKFNLLCHIWSVVDRGQEVTKRKTRGQEVSDCDRKQMVTTGHWAALTKSLELYILLWEIKASSEYE